ncbi:MAG: hypothetical protein CVT95_11990 [Bacteroidetes bacterium HGW-Bacteroidetes-12]|nr:MAG: hypothetical protein CVT95_11990 [Bacteroidetes bacterium HGW-Bacteroidetes-12]
MKHSFYLLLILSLFYFSCSSDTEKATSDTLKQIESSSDKKTEAFETLGKNPCNLISAELVIKYFDVSESELEKDERVNSEKLSWLDYCTYRWKKPNYDEIKKRNTDLMIANTKKMMANKSKEVESAMKIATTMEKAEFSLGITNIRLHKTDEKALKSFKQSHTVPSDADMLKLDEEIEKQAADKKISNEDADKGKKLAGGIQHSLKFQTVEGIGTTASWDFLAGRLDVLYGTIQFGVIIHTGEGLDKDIEKAKRIADEIISKI